MNQKTKFKTRVTTFINSLKASKQFSVNEDLLDEVNKNVEMDRYDNYSELLVGIDGMNMPDKMTESFHNKFGKLANRRKSKSRTPVKRDGASSKKKKKNGSSSSSKKKRKRKKKKEEEEEEEDIIKVSESESGNDDEDEDEEKKILGKRARKTPQQKSKKKKKVKKRKRKRSKSDDEDEAFIPDDDEDDEDDEDEDDVVAMEKDDLMEGNEIENDIMEELTKRVIVPQKSLKIPEKVSDSSEFELSEPGVKKRKISEDENDTQLSSSSGTNGATSTNSSGNIESTPKTNKSQNNNNVNGQGGNNSMGGFNINPFLFGMNINNSPYGVPMNVLNQNIQGRNLMNNMNNMNLPVVNRGMARSPFSQLFDEEKNLLFNLSQGEELHEVFWERASLQMISSLLNSHVGKPSSKQLAKMLMKPINKTKGNSVFFSQFSDEKTMQDKIPLKMILQNVQFDVAKVALEIVKEEENLAEFGRTLDESTLDDLMMEAMKKNEFGAVTILTKMGANVDINNIKGNIDVQFVKQMIERCGLQSLINDKDQHSRTLLHRAVEAKNIQLVQLLLLRYEARDDLTDINGETPQALAAQSKDIELITAYFQCMNLRMQTMMSRRQKY